MKFPARLKSIRVVLTAWYSTMLLIAFALFATSTYFFLQQFLLDTLDQDLSDEADWVIRVVTMRRGPSPDSLQAAGLSEPVQTLLDDHFGSSTRNYIVLLASSNGTVFYESENRENVILHEGEVSPDEPVYVSKQTRLGRLRITARRSNAYVLQIAYPERPVEMAATHLLSIFAVLAPIALLFAVSGGWLFARLAFRPIDEITEMANRITAKNLAQRIPARAVTDEIGRLIATINSMIERLQLSFSQIRQFSLNIAHELRTPLTILKGESELALSKPLKPEDARQLANTYLEETVRLSRIVDDLLTLAKADAGQMRIQQESIEFRTLIDELYENAQLLSSSRELNVVLEHNDEVRLVGDATRLRQMLRNLVMNAIFYTPKGGTISIASRTHGQAVEVSIRDTGIGIPRDELANIFLPFYRAEQARQQSKGGSGLGLAISQWIAQAHGGTISATSVPGVGSTFTARLPLDSTPP